jgi:hypothetical protein
MDDAHLCTSCNHVLSKLMILPCSCLSAYDTRIGSAYIIMEKVDGVTERAAPNPTAKDYRPLLECILKAESRCFKVVFSLFGDLYYKKDVSPELQMIELYADSSEIKDGADRLRIGPSTQRAFWRGERGSMDLDYGPCGCHFLMCLSKAIYSRHRNQGDLLLITWRPLPNPRYPRSQSTLVPETTLTSIALITHRHFSYSWMLKQAINGIFIGSVYTAKSDPYEVDTIDVLFILSGTFVGLDKVVQSQLAEGVSFS